MAGRARVSHGVELVLYALAVTMAVGDCLENPELLFLSWGSDAPEVTAALERLRVFTLVKWYAIYVASAMVAGGIWREPGWWRWSALLFAAAAVLGFSSVMHLPAIEYSSVALFAAWTATYVRSLR